MKNNTEHIQNAHDVRNHLGACTTVGKTEQEIARIDERFFLACKQVKPKSKQTKTVNKFEVLPKRYAGNLDYLGRAEKHVSEPQDFI